MKPSMSQVSVSKISPASINNLVQKLRMGVMAVALLLVWSSVAIGNNPLQVEVALKNAFRDGDRYYFDLYLSQVGQAPILLAFSDLAFNIQPYDPAMSLHYVAGSAQLRSESGLPVNYNEQFDVQLLNRQGQMVAMINADAPANVSASNYLYKVAQIDGYPLQHRLGRFYLANFQGNINDFSLEIRLNAEGSNSKMYGFIADQQFKAEVVELSYSQTEAGEQQALRSIQVQFANNVVAVAWESAFEQNVLSYQLLKSFDGLSWRLVEEVAAHNAQQASEQYQLEDKAPANGQVAQAVVYYKLQANGQNGLLVESAVKQMVISSAISFNIYPNPAREQVQVRLGQAVELQNFELRVFDGAGRMVYQQWHQGVDQPAIDLNNFAAGAYFVQVQSGDQQSVNRLVVIK